MRTHPNSNVPCGATERDEDREVAFAQCARCMLVERARGGEERRGERNGESGEESSHKKMLARARRSGSKRGVAHRQCSNTLVRVEHRSFVT